MILILKIKNSLVTHVDKNQQNLKKIEKTTF